MKHKYSYCVAEYSDDIEDSFDIASNWSEDSPEFIAADCAEDYFWGHDGIKDKWPVTIILWMDNGYPLGKYEASFEPEPPYFIAKQIKESAVLAQENGPKKG